MPVEDHRVVVPGRYPALVGDIIGINRHQIPEDLQVRRAAVPEEMQLNGGFRWQVPKAEEAEIRPTDSKVLNIGHQPRQVLAGHQGPHLETPGLGLAQVQHTGNLHGGMS